MTYFPSVTITPSNTLQDAFGRMRISNPQTIFDSKQIADKQPLFWDDAQTSGSGTTSTFNTNQASTTIAVSASTAGTRIRQTYRHFNYQPGKSQLIFLTAVVGSGASGITKRLGLFNTNNGLFFEIGSSGISVVRRTNTSGTPADTSVAQASWNIDPLDGSGTSGITLDLTKTQIFVIDYEWLGVGSVRFGFVINGVIYYCHQMNHANSLTVVYMSTPNLPIRYEITNVGSGGANSLTHICTTVISEGGRQENGFELAIDRDSTGLTTLNNTSIYPLISVRLRSGYEGATIQFSDISLICTSTAAFRWVILLNPTVAGTALSFSAITNSAVEADIGTTNASTVTGGTILASGYSQASSEASVNYSLPTGLTLGSSIAGTRDIVVLAVQRLTGTTETFYGSLGWNETV